jgi:phosphoglycerate dehydrogenase-like enzyme
MTGPNKEPLVVCLSFPGFHAPRFAASLEAIDSRIEVVRLPPGEGVDWSEVAPGEPHDEPPPCASDDAEARRQAFERAEVMVALHTPTDLMRWAPRLRWLQGIGAGVEQFAAAGVPRDRVIVTNASGVSAPSMAEWVIGRLLQVWKRFRDADTHQTEHSFTRTYGRTFAGSTVGIVGLGSIGCEVSKRARALGARVLGLKRSARPGDTSEWADELFGTAQLHEMLGRCDAVVIAAPATPETRHLFDAAAFAAMKPGATLVNVARGSLLDEAALAEAMAAGQVAAAALDVFDKEPLPASSPLWDIPGVYISAHSSVSVDRYLDDIFDVFRDNMERYVVGEPLEKRVDMKALGFR